ncbi:DUF1579 domain-containing protein [Hymenobacter sp. RP-2-7]|uniref:DUF1579 domain-containing protein n=1 Tax=Hymenobacter polaris TaxID=2682546 RepID=A0A7Y0AIN3_9BACT|nr:DUF1579 family protein [Hymenobacter polaris]NML67989.1 DUF1579 domain-containing protein [Hymenobacter polaris]
MKKRPFARNLLGVLAWAPLAMPVLAQSQKDAPLPATNPGPSQAELTEVATPDENHQLLASLSGTWAFVGRHTLPGPAKRTFEFRGTVVRTALLNGRYFRTETTGAPLKMAWSAGELVPYSDVTLEGYDKVKKKFVTASFSNELDTGIITTEGTYDPATRTITYAGETVSHIHRDMPLGTKFTFQDTVRITDHDHFVFTRHEFVAGQEVITTELTYTRTKNQ